MATRAPFGTTLAKLKTRLRENPSGAFVFYGPEEMLKQFYLSKFFALAEKEGMAEFNIARLDFRRGADFSRLMQETDILPFGGTVRIVACRGCNPAALPEAQQKPLLALLDNFPEYLSLVFVLTESEFSADRKTVEKKAVIKLAEKMDFVLFPLQDEKTLLSWAQKILARDGLQAEERTLKLLFRLCDGRMQIIRNELEKLCAYALSQNRTSVREEDVYLFGQDATQSAVWNLSDAVLDGAVDAAAHILKNLRRQEMSPQIIVNALAKMLTECLMLLEGATDADCAKVSRIASWQCKRYRAALCGKKREWLEKAMFLCSELDRRLKSKHSNAQNLTEVAVLTMTRILGGKE